MKYIVTVAGAAISISFKGQLHCFAADYIARNDEEEEEGGMFSLIVMVNTGGGGGGGSIGKGIGFTELLRKWCGGV